MISMMKRLLLYESFESFVDVIYDNIYHIFLHYYAAVFNFTFLIKAGQNVTRCFEPRMIAMDEAMDSCCDRGAE